MEVIFKNFKKYENKSFFFPIGKTTLISGPSGAGKSTIIEGIKFSLFGLPSNNNLRSFKAQDEKNSKIVTQVTLRFENLEILRSRSPNAFLKVNGKVGDIAQQEIFSIFGTNFFDFKNFLNHGSKERVKDIEKYIPNFYKASEIRDNIKKEIKNVNLKIIESEKKIAFYTYYLKTFSIPEKIPKNLKSLEFYNLELENFRSELSEIGYHEQHEEIIKKIKTLGKFSPVTDSDYNVAVYNQNRDIERKFYEDELSKIPYVNSNLEIIEKQIETQRVLIDSQEKEKEREEKYRELNEKKKF